MSAGSVSSARVYSPRMAAAVSSPAVTCLMYRPLNSLTHAVTFVA